MNPQDRSRTIQRLLVPVLITAAIWIGSPRSLQAQSVPRLEVGPVFSSTPFLIGTPSDVRATGFGGRIVFNAHRSIAGEFQLSAFPTIEALNGSGLHAAG